MVKDHSAREETCCCHYISNSIQLAAMVLLFAQTIAHTMGFGTPVVEHWLE